MKRSQQVVYFQSTALVQVGNIYFATHQFKEAAEFLGKSLQVNPKNVAIRTELASCLYYAGDVDGALQQLMQATTDDPKDANSLFNFGMIRWQGKKIPRARCRLREIDFGVLDGFTKHGIAHHHPEEKDRRSKLGKYHHRPPAGENYPDVALRLHSFLGTLTREIASKSVLVVCHSVVVLIFRKLLERLSEQQLLAIDADKDQEVRNCSVTHYEFDPGAGANGKLVLREFNRVYYSDDLQMKKAAE